MQALENTGDPTEQSITVVRDVAEICMEAIRNAYSDREDADHAVREVFEQARATNDDRALGWGLCARAKHHLRDGKLEDALIALRLALEKAEQAGDVPLQGFCNQFLGAYYFERSEYAQAIEFSYQAVLVRRTLPSSMDLAHSLGGLGAIHAMLGNWQESVNCLTEALELARQDGNIMVQATMLSNMGELFADLGEESIGRALDCYSQATELARTLANKHLLVNCLSAWAHLLIGQYRWSEAETLLSETIEVAQRCALTRSQIKTNVALATLCFEQARFAEAHAYLKKASHLAEQDSTRYPELPQSWARYHWRHGNLLQARECFEKALGDANAIGQRDTVMAIERQLSELLEELGDHASALTYFKSFFERHSVVEKQSAKNLLIAQKAKADVERAQQEAQLERLRNVELAEANRQKDHLLTQLQLQKDRLARQAIEDPLTGLYNRRFLMEQLEYATEEALHSRRKLAVMIADLDNFKKINDTYSHAVGDEVLKGTARLLLENCRRDDVVARYGGEEFVVVFPDTDAACAAAICERIRAAVERFPWQQFHPELKVSLSIGVADERETRYEKLLAIADRRLYRAKHGGKNRVVDWRTEAEEKASPPLHGTVPLAQKSPTT